MVSLLSVLFLRCWSFALFCLWSFEFFSWFPFGFVTVSPLPPPSHSPVPYHQRYPRPLLASHLTCHLTSLVFVAHIAWYSFISHFTSIITSHARTHILFFFHTRTVHLGFHVTSVERFSLTTPSSLFVVVRLACTPFILRVYDKNRLSIILGCKVKSLIH